jgi:hypothetical protein
MSSKACTAPTKLSKTDCSYPLLMQVSQEQLIRLEPNQTKSETKQYLGQQKHEYKRLISTITIETLVISY